MQGAIATTVFLAETVGAVVALARRLVPRPAAAPCPVSQGALSPRRR